MKRIGLLFVPLMFFAFNLWAQDNSTKDDTSQREAHKAAAQSDENAADQKKADAKNAGTASGAERDKVLARLDSASKVLNELLGAPDKGVPEDVFRSAKCVAVVPSLGKGGFIFG